MRRNLPPACLLPGCLLPVVIAAPLCAMAPATATPSPAGNADLELLDALRSLRAEIAEFKRSVDDPEHARLDEARAQEIRSLVAEVIADADTRASLQGSGVTAGWNKGFFLASPDGNFSLKISGYAQISWIYGHRSDPPSGQDGSQSGFENRRTYITFDGHVVDPSWVYRVQGNFQRSGGVFLLQDTYVRKNFDGGFFVQGGQAKAPFMRETLASDAGLLLVDRSVVEATFGIGRTQGVFVGWSNDTFRIVGTYCDGSQPAGGANNGWDFPTTEYAFIGRAEAKFGGNWNQFNGMTSFPDDEKSGLIGAAVLWQRGDTGSRFAGVETLGWTVDGTLNLGGASLFAAVVGRHLDSDDGNFDQFGPYGQGGIFVAPTVELFGRYEWADSDTSGADLSLVTAGANWYIARQQLKLSGDIGYGINAVSPFFGATSSATGWRTDAEGDDGQIVVRVQFQLMF
ncbi:MAG TPA: porin [Phycisphaerales bacterium]|nr:porin [Phycisphaerales bacterium]HMP36998.1 porin [Phycisphaerales bacterium]